MEELKTALTMLRDVTDRTMLQVDDLVEGVASMADSLVSGAMLAAQVVKEWLGQAGNRIFPHSRSSARSLHQEDNSHVRESG